MLLLEMERNEGGACMCWQIVGVGSLKLARLVLFSLVNIT